MMKRFFLLLVSSAFMLSVNAQQEVNLKYGKPTKEEMAMTLYRSAKQLLDRLQGEVTYQGVET